MNEPDPASQIPDYQSLMLPVLRTAEHGEVRVGNVIEKLADALGLDEAARSALLASGRQTIFANRVHWAKTYLAKAGLGRSHATWPLPHYSARCRGGQRST